MHRRNRRFVPPPVKAGEGGGDTLACMLRHDFQAHADGRGAAARAALSREAFGPFEKKRHAPAPSAVEAAAQPAHGVPLSLASWTPSAALRAAARARRPRARCSATSACRRRTPVYLHRAATRSRAQLTVRTGYTSGWRVAGARPRPRRGTSEARDARGYLGDLLLRRARRRRAAAGLGNGGRRRPCRHRLSRRTYSSTASSSPAASSRQRRVLVDDRVFGVGAADSDNGCRRRRRRCHARASGCRAGADDGAGASGEAAAEALAARRAAAGGGALPLGGRQASPPAPPSSVCCSPAARARLCAQPYFPRRTCSRVAPRRARSRHRGG